MQKKLIKVGEEYRVEIDGLGGPSEYKTYGTPVKYPHAHTFRGVSQSYGTQARATVKALDQKRPTRGVGYHVGFENDGVLVEFSEPVKVGFYDNKKTVKTAVLSTRHILQPWAEYAQDREETVRWAKIHRDNAAKKAEEFRPQIDALLDGDHGLKATESDSGVLVEGKGGDAFVRFEISRHGNEEFVTGWSWRNVEVARELFFALLGVEGA